MFLFSRSYSRVLILAFFLLHNNHNMTTTITIGVVPGAGKPGGEDSNYGLLSVDGLSYSALQIRMKQVLAQANEIHSAGRGACVLDTVSFAAGAPAGRLQLVAAPKATGGVSHGVSEAAVGPVEQQCLQAQSTGEVVAAVCVPTTPIMVTTATTAAAATQRWEILSVGGAIGQRLRNVGSGGCLNIELAGSRSHSLRADGDCSTPTDWHWPPAWEHDDDCSVMQYCGYPNINSSWTYNVCTYDQSCVTVAGGGEVLVGPCAAINTQRFAFVA
jgi:hypothetical protein